MKERYSERKKEEERKINWSCYFGIEDGNKTPCKEFDHLVPLNFIPKM